LIRALDATIFLSFIFILATLGPVSFAQSNLMIEAGPISQSQNDQRVPGDTGTDFSISNFDDGPFAGYRIYAGHIWNQRHEVRALYAPLEIEVNGQFQETVNFQNADFAASIDSTAYYKFNSYRATYAYHFDPPGNWQLALGFTAKVRDAEVRLSQGGLTRSKSNVGFVPLLHLQMRYEFGNNWRFRFDFDG
jgi:hypothetical protein